MADYPSIDLPPVSALRVAAESAVVALRGAMAHIALPPRRLDLEAAAVALEKALEGNSKT